jgi:hypothetical protein
VFDHHKHPFGHEGMTFCEAGKTEQSAETHYLLGRLYYVHCSLLDRWYV